MIEINNLTETSVNKDFLKELAEKVLKSENIKKDSLSVVLVGPGRMRKLNKLYRGKNKITDVLSFSDKDIKKTKFILPSALKNGELGEIVICLREVKKNAVKNNFQFRRELGRVLIHGILHILGYEHEKSQKQENIMKKKEEYYIKMKK